VTEVYEQIGSLLDKRRRTADEDARPSHRRGPTVLSISASIRRANPPQSGGGSRVKV
jgi:hypothetical protein